VRRAVLLGVGASLLFAAPASADVTINGLASLTWDTPDVSVAVGETVHWKFPDTSQAHNVQSDDVNPPTPEWAAFKPSVAIPAPDEQFTFNTPGTYLFVCQVHPDTMIGSVTVGAAAPPPPRVIPLSEQPFGNDSPPLGTAETVSLDTTKPKLTSLSARRSGRGGARVRFRVSEESVVDVRLKRGGKVVKRYAAAGSGTLAFTAKALKAGRYRVEVRAYDVAGNASSLKRVSLTVR